MKMSYGFSYMPQYNPSTITASYYDPVYNQYLKLLQWRYFYDWVRENEGGYPMNDQIIFQRYYEFLEKQGLIQSVSVVPGIIWTPMAGYIPTY
jgi:hypothetical protein